MKQSRLGLIAAAVVVLASCSAPKSPDPAALEASATARILAIPPATPEKYRGMVDMKGWRNPYLIIRADGVALLDPDEPPGAHPEAGRIDPGAGQSAALGVAVRARGRGDRKWRARFRRR